MITSEQMEIMRQQDRTEKDLHKHRILHGEKATEILASGMMIGVVSYITKHYGTARAYEAFQQIADCVAEEKLS